MGQLQLDWKLQRDRPIINKSANLQTEQQIANPPNAKFIIEQNFIEKQTFKFLLSFQKYIAKINFLTFPIEKSSFINILYFLYCTYCTCFRIS